MDDRRFDLLVKSIGRSTSRRTLLRGMLGIAATAAGVTALRQDQTDAARRGFSGPTFPTPLPACGANLTRCGTVCVDTVSDPTNCGGCGNTCDTSTSTCTGGSCVERCAGVNCTGLDTYCTVGVCNPATGTCAAEVANENGACTTGGGAAGTCTTGTCVANPVTCSECWHEENGHASWTRPSTTAPAALPTSAVSASPILRLTMMGMAASVAITTSAVSACRTRRSLSYRPGT